MKKILITIGVAIAFFTCHAQVYFNTGSLEMDANLNEINLVARANIDEFKVELSKKSGAPTLTIDKLLKEMEPAEVYLALEISRISKKPVEEVAKSYKTNKSKGWGYIAKQMGIKPGSSEFHELKSKTKNNADKAKNKGKGNSNGKGKKK